MNSKHWLGSKTLWVNILGGIAATTGTVSGVIPPKYAPGIIAAGSIANILLRLVTKQPLTTGDPDQHVDVSKVGGFAVLPVLIIVAAAAIGGLFIAKTKPTPAQLLTYAQFGVEADCAIGTDALAKDICTFGTDAIGAAKAALDKDPVAGKVAAKQILLDAEVKYPQFAPYVNFVVSKL